MVPVLEPIFRSFHFYEYKLKLKITRISKTDLALHSTAIQLEVALYESKSKSITSNKNKPLLMSSHEVDRCNDILKARKSAISRGKDPDDAEQRIRRKF